MFIFVVRSLCVCLLEVLQLAMLIRAVLSWLPIADDSKFESFIYGITEPIIYPVRAVLDRFESISALPVDIPFFVTYLLLMLLSAIL